MTRLNFYDVEVIRVCPYCGDGPKGDDFGCCGESSAHFEEVYQHENGETYQFDEVTLYRPIGDFIQYEILNRFVWRQRIRRNKRRVRDWFTKLYDGKNSHIRTLRALTGFQWTKLDRLILEQLHDFPLYTKSSEQWAEIRKESVKSMRDAWSRGELLGCNLYPAIRDDE